MAYAVAALLVPAMLTVLVAEPNSTNDELDYLISKEKERVRVRLMKELELTELPPPSNSTKGLPESVLQVMLEEAEPPVQENQQNLTRILLLPTNSDFSCHFDNSSTCHRFEYVISQGALLQTARLWFQKVSSPSAPHVTPLLSFICHHPADDQERLLGRDRLPAGIQSNKWTSRRLAGLWQVRHWSGDMLCSVEMTDIAINTFDGSRPVLRMFEDLADHSRHRRSEDEDVISESCQTIPFVIAFEDIGFQDVFYPKNYQAQLCKGDCVEPQSLHEVVLDYAFRTNDSLQQRYGRCWATCCKPKRYRNLRLLYREMRNETEIFVDRVFVDMIVESCWCG